MIQYKNVRPIGLGLDHISGIPWALSVVYSSKKMQTFLKSEMIEIIVNS